MDVQWTAGCGTGFLRPRPLDTHALHCTALQVPSLHAVFSHLYTLATDEYQLRTLYKMCDR